MIGSLSIKFLRLYLASLFLLMCSHGWSAITNQEVMIGFFAPGVSASPVTRIYDETRYNINAASVPADLGRIRLTNIAYLDQFPDGEKVDPETIAALHALMERGGVVILLGGPDSSQSTIDFFNKLGENAGFQLTDQVLSGQITPVHPGHGPLDGNVWFCEKGVRALELSGAGWHIYHRSSEGNAPVIASRRVGKGVLLVSGTREIERPNAVKPQSALTLINWGYEHSKGSSEEIKNSNPDDDKVALTDSEVQRVINTPTSDLLSDRVHELRAVLNAGDSSKKLTDSILIPRTERQYFPPLGNASDLQGTLVDLDDYRDSVVLLVYWATWDEDSRQMVREIDQMLSELDDSKVQGIGISLDASEQAVKSFVRDNKIEWRQVFDGQAYASSLMRRPLIREIPRTFLLDHDGRLAASDLPAFSMRLAIEEALRER